MLDLNPAPPLTLYPAGELDIASAPAELAPSNLAGADDVRIDLRYVTFIDAYSLGRIVLLRNIMSDRSGTLAVVSPSARVARVFTVAGLTTLLSDPAYSSP